MSKTTTIVELRFEVTDDQRRAIAAKVGSRGLAQNAELVEWCRGFVGAELAKLDTETPSEGGG